MNKVILLGRLTRDPEVRYSQGANSIAVARYSLAVNRRFKTEGQPDADFINIVAFGKSGEFAEKYLKKGMQIAVVGNIRTDSYVDKNNNKRYSTFVVAEEQNFTESKRAYEQRMGSAENAGNNQAPSTDGFVPVDVSDEDDLPF